jgi:peptidoglycan DL-endopeptidase CwlO
MTLAEPEPIAQTEPAQTEYTLTLPAQTEDTRAAQARATPAQAEWGPIAAAASPAETTARTRTDIFHLNAVVTERIVAAQRPTRRPAGVRRAAPRRATTTLAARTVRAAERSAARASRALRRAAVARKTAALRRLSAAVGARPGQTTRPGEIRRVRAAVPHRRTVVTKHAIVKHAQRVMPLGNGMTAVIAFARSQIGKRYVSGGEGPYGFDCSGFTKRAYARVGIRLPHSSGAQAARARTVSRAQARPGDLVVGPGHVGIYMGRGMMIDAGNSRTGVVYRKLYSGLRVARL